MTERIPESPDVANCQRFYEVLANAAYFGMSGEEWAVFLEQHPYESGRKLDEQVEEVLFGRFIER